MNLQFEHAWVLYLLWLVPLAGVLTHVLVARRPAGAGFLSATMAARLAPAPAPVRRTWQIALVSTGLLLALIALARPQWGTREETVYQRGRDVMLVLDVSRSMLATDVHPSRLGRAKVDLLDLIKQLRGDRAGLLAFRGRPVLACPLTTDYGFLSQVLDGIDIDSAPPGETDIGDAIIAALDAFDSGEGAHKAIVLISDGDDLGGRVDTAIEKAREQGVTIFTVGLGSTEGAKVPAPGGQAAFMMYKGSAVTSKLNHQVMQELAEKTGGAYVPVGVANVKLGDLYRDHLSRVSARDLEESVQHRVVERFQVFLFPAVLCLLAAGFLSRGQTMLGRKAARPAPSTTPVAPAATTPPPLPITPPPLTARAGAWLALLAGLATPLLAATTKLPPTAAEAPVPAAPPPIVAATNVAPGRAGALKAQALYATGRYEDAASAYLGAARNSVRRPRFDYLFNAGCALMKAGRHEEAADTFRGLLGMEDADLGTAAYNLGCALDEAATARTKTAGPTPVQPGQPAGQPDATAAEDRANDLKQAVTAFQRATRVNPDDADGRRNLAVVSAKALQAQDEARIAKALATYGQMPPGALGDLMLQKQRELNREVATVFTNDTPTLIPALEALADKQDDTTDILIPLKGKLLDAIAHQPQSQSSNAPSPQQMAAQINGFAESIRDQLANNADALRDLDRNACSRAPETEEPVYNMWKIVAPHDSIIYECLRRQTNTIAMTASNVFSATHEMRARIGEEQSEVRNITELFKTRFEQTVPPEGISVPVQPSTNAAAGSTNAATASTNTTKQILSPEDRAKIVELTGQALAAQQAAAAAVTNNLGDSLTHQHRSYNLLKEIEKLLPKQDPPPQPQQQQQQQQQQNQQQEQNKPPEPPKEQPPQPKEQKPEPKPEPKPGDLSKEDVQRMLEKAKEREKEHDQEKRQREQYAPLSPAERDW